MNMITFKQALDISREKTEEGKHEYIIVDLRNKFDYQKSHLDGAINLPSATMRTIESLGLKNKKWVLYCSRGNYSLRLALYMEEKGYVVMPVIGGYKWF